MMNKRGIEMTISTLVVIILGLVVLVFLIYGFTVGFDFFFGKFEQLPGQDLETVAQSCKIAATGNLRIDYCTFKEVSVDGNEEFVNCNDQRIQDAIGSDIDKITCQSPYTEADYCKGKAGTVIVNRRLCSDF